MRTSGNIFGTNLEFEEYLVQKTILRYERTESVSPNELNQGFSPPFNFKYTFNVQFETMN